MKNSAMWVFSILAIMTILTQITVIINQQTQLDIVRQDVLNKQKDIENLLLSVPAQQPDFDKKPPPPGKSFNDGHWHGDYWHDTSE